MPREFFASPPISDGHGARAPVAAIGGGSFTREAYIEQSVFGPARNSSMGAFE
jgi:hypothetical protein